MSEVWKPVVYDLYKDHYQVSSMGQVKSAGYDKTSKRGWRVTKPARVLHQNSTDGRYVYVRLMVDGVGKTIKTHRIVADAFIPNPENKPYINHINGDKRDNRVENLEWCTQSENMLHSYWKLNYRNTPAVPVVQYSLEGNRIAEYPSINDAARATGCLKQRINECLKGVQHKTKGYVWKRS